MLIDFSSLLRMSSEPHRTTDTSVTEMSVKAMNYPPGYTENSSKEQSDRTDVKHKDYHPMRCHHIQPMQSAINTISNDLSQTDAKK